MEIKIKSIIPFRSKSVKYNLFNNYILFGSLHLKWPVFINSSKISLQIPGSQNFRLVSFFNWNYSHSVPNYLNEKCKNNFRHSIQTPHPPPFPTSTPLENGFSWEGMNVGWLMYLPSSICGGLVVDVGGGRRARCGSPALMLVPCWTNEKKAEGRASFASY